MFKKAVAMILCILLTVSAAGCQSGGGASSAENGKPVESTADGKSTPAGGDKVELMIWETSRDQDDFSKQMEEKFLKENPDITLKKVIKEGDPGNEFYQAVAAGNAPDYINVSFTMMDKYMKARILEPMNNYVKNWDEWSRFSKEYVGMFTRDGKALGVPRTVSPMLFAYNKALFKKAGIKEAPKTWDEALADAKKINNPSKQITGYATLAAEWTEWFFQYYVWQAGGDLTKQNADSTIALTFTDPAVIKAAKYYQKLSSEGVLQADRTLKFTDLTTAFGQGKIGMMPFAGDWVSDAIKQGIDLDDIGLCLPPAGPSGSQVTAIAGTVDCINAKSTQEKKDAAWKYIKFYNSKEFIAAYFENKASKGAANPVIIPRDDMSATDYFDFPQEYMNVLGSVKSVGRLEFYGKADFGVYVDKAVQKVLSNPNADAETEFKAGQTLAQNEALARFNESAKMK